MSQTFNSQKLFFKSIFVKYFDPPTLDVTSPEIFNRNYLHKSILFRSERSMTILIFLFCLTITTLLQISVTSSTFLMPSLTILLSSRKNFSDNQNGNLLCGLISFGEHSSENSAVDVWIFYIPYSLKQFGTWKQPLEVCGY